MESGDGFKYSAVANASACDNYGDPLRPKYHLALRHVAVGLCYNCLTSPLYSFLSKGDGISFAFTFIVRSRKVGLMVQFELSILS